MDYFATIFSKSKQKTLANIQFVFKLVFKVFSATCKRTSNVFLMKLLFIIILKKCIGVNDNNFLRRVISKNNVPNDKKHCTFQQFLLKRQKNQLQEHSLLVQGFKRGITNCFYLQVPYYLHIIQIKNCVELSERILVNFTNLYVMSGIFRIIFTYIFFSTDFLAMQQLCFSDSLITKFKGTLFLKIIFRYFITKVLPFSLSNRFS